MAAAATERGRPQLLTGWGGDEWRGVACIQVEPETSDKSKLPFVDRMILDLFEISADYAIIDAGPHLRLAAPQTASIVLTRTARWAVHVCARAEVNAVDANTLAANQSWSLRISYLLFGIYYALMARVDLVVYFFVYLNQAC